MLKYRRVFCFFFFKSALDICRPTAFRFMQAGERKLNLKEKTNLLKQTKEEWKGDFYCPQHFPLLTHSWLSLNKFLLNQTFSSPNQTYGIFSNIFLCHVCLFQTKEKCPTHSTKSVKQGWAAISNALFSCPVSH